MLHVVDSISGFLFGAIGRNLQAPSVLDLSDVVSFDTSRTRLCTNVNINALASWSKNTCHIVQRTVSADFDIKHANYLESFEASTTLIPIPGFVGYFVAAKNT